MLLYFLFNSMASSTCVSQYTLLSFFTYYFEWRPLCPFRNTLSPPLSSLLFYVWRLPERVTLGEACS